MVWKILFFTFVFYCLYRVTVRIILPVWRTTRRIRKSFRAVEEEMKRQQQNRASAAGPAQNPKQESSIGGEYIDFEEVK